MVEPRETNDGRMLLTDQTPAFAVFPSVGRVPPASQSGSAPTNQEAGEQ